MSSTAAPADLSTVDINDPRAQLSALRRAYLMLIGGQNEVRILFRDGDSQEDVTFGNGSIPEIRREMTRLEGVIAALEGGRPARRCITAG